MLETKDILPTTAIVAIGIFLTKEIIEAFRRHSADKRKLLALKALIARECELNNWCIKRLSDIFNNIDTPENKNPGIIVSIEETPSGRPYVKVISDDEGLETHSSIPEVHRELMTKFLLDIATLDKGLFGKLEPAYDILAEVAHIKDSLVRSRDADERTGEAGYLSGLAYYATGVLVKADTAIKELYKYCTGQELTKHRLR
jgi:hypothetical protein